MGNQSSREVRTARRGKRRKSSGDDSSSYPCSEKSLEEVCVCRSAPKRLRHSSVARKCTAATQTDKKLGSDRVLVPRQQPCGVCKEFFGLGLLSDIPVRQGERIGVCPGCLIDNQTALSVVQNSLQGITPSSTHRAREVQRDHEAQGDFRRSAISKHKEEDFEQPPQARELGRNCADNDMKHGLMEELRSSNEKRTHKIAYVLHKLDERLTNIQNMTSRSTSFELPTPDGSSEKLWAELRSLEVKTRSLDAKLTAADRKQEQMESQILGATENLRNVLDQLVVLENRNKLLDDNVHAIVRRVGGYEESNRALGERVNSVRSDMEYSQESTRKSDEKMDNLTTAVQFQLKKMKEMEGHFSDMDDRLDKVTEEMGAVEGKLHSRSIKVADVTAKLSEFDNKFRMTEQSIRKLENSQEPLKDLPDIQVKLRQLSDKVGYLGSGVPSTDSIMHEVDKIFEPVKRKLDSMDQKLSEVQREHNELMKQRRVLDLPSALKSPQPKKVTFEEPVPSDRPRLIPEKSLDHGKTPANFEESDSSADSEVFEPNTPTVNKTNLPTRPRSAPAGRPLLATKQFSLRAGGKLDFMGGSDEALNSRNPLKSSLKTSMDSLLPLKNKELTGIATNSSNFARKSSMASPARQTGFVPWDDLDGERETAPKNGGFKPNPAIAAINSQSQKSGNSIRPFTEIEVDDHGSGDS